MASVTIQINRADIYHIAEGISVTISLHNGGTPTHEQLWASQDEARKLDIHYREAVADLERRLMEWLSASSSQFDLKANGTDYTLTLAMDRFWPSRLEGLLANKIQDYMVHAVTAGWLNDFSGLDVKQDYAAMAVQDLSDIRLIIYQRSFGWADSPRGTDPDTKQDGIAPTAGSRNVDTETKQDGIAPTAGSRNVDTETKEDGISPTAGSRNVDTEIKEDGISPTAGARNVDTETKEDGIAPTAKSRNVDTETKEDGISPSAEARAVDTETKEDGIAPTAERRRTDTKKDMFVLPADPISRKKDDIVKPNADRQPPLCRPVYARHKDNAVVEHHQDYTDWSGTDYGRAGGYPPRGMRPGYHNHHYPASQVPEPPRPKPEPPVVVARQHTGQPMPPGPCGHPQPGMSPMPQPGCHHDQFHPDCPLEHPHNPYEHVDPNRPQHPSDDYSEEKFINSHSCGHHDCGHHGVNPLDWEFNDTDGTEELDDATFTKNR